MYSKTKDYVVIKTIRHKKTTLNPGYLLRWEDHSTWDDGKYFYNLGYLKEIDPVRQINLNKRREMKSASKVETNKKKDTDAK